MSVMAPQLAVADAGSASPVPVVKKRKPVAESNLAVDAGW